MKKYELNAAEKDIVAASNISGGGGTSEDTVQFESNEVYLIQQLEFGGYLAFEPNFVHCYKRRIRTKVVSMKLRNPMRIKAICQIDKYNSETKLTAEGNNILRYMFATEEGELYMLAFYLDSVHLVTGAVSNSVNQQQQEANQFIVIEFLGSHLSNCSSLVYLDNGYLYYGSKYGDSYLIQLQTQNQGNPDMPYIMIIQTYPNLGPVQDLVIKNPMILKGQQHEMLLLGGTGYNSHITVIKKGISVKKIEELKDLPGLMPNGLFYVADKIALRFFDID